jgi:hypothetical protein
VEEGATKEEKGRLKGREGNVGRLGNPKRKNTFGRGWKTYDNER